MNKNKLMTSLIFLVLDQVIKGLIQTYEINCVIIKNIFSIKYITNTGAAFSIMQNHSVALMVVSFVILLLVYNLSFSYKSDKLTDFSFGILYAGILGNLVDRCLFRYVRDYISIGNFPVFNLADICIVMGIVLIIYISIKGELNKKGSDSSDDKGRRRNNSKNR